MYVIIVKTVLHPGNRDAFLQAMLPNATASVANEPGCRVFDVLEAREEPETFYLYEIYDSTDALAAHKETDHYKTTRSAVNPMIKDQSVIRADVIEANPKIR